MKTRNIFEPSDFKGSGQLLIRNSSPPGSPDLSFAVSVTYKVGYGAVLGKSYFFLISMADGLAMTFDTMEDLCVHLNRDTYGFRPMTKEEVIGIIGEHGPRF